MLPEGRPTIRGISQMFGSLNVLELSLPTKFKAMMFNFSLLKINNCARDVSWIKVHLYDTSVATDTDLLVGAVCSEKELDHQHWVRS